MILIQAFTFKFLTTVEVNFLLSLKTRAHNSSVEDYVESLESKTTKEKTKQDVKLLEQFLRNEKNDK